MNLLGNLTFITSIADNGNATSFASAQDVVYTTINGATYVFVAGQGDSGIQVLRLQNNTFTPVFNIVDSGGLTLSGARSLELVSVGGVKYLVVSAFNENGIATFEINEENTGSDGHLSQIDSIVDAAIDGPYLSGVYDMKSVTVGANTFVITASYNDDALSVYRVETGGLLTLTDTVTDAENVLFNLDNAWTLATGAVGTKTFVYVGSYSTDAGISGYQLLANGTLVSVANIEVASSSFRTMTMAQTSGGTYLVAFNYNGYDMIVYSVAGSGALTEVSRFDAYVNGAVNDYYDFRSLEVFRMDGATFIIGASNNDDGMVVYSLDDAGVMNFVTALKGTEVDRINNVRLFSEGGRHYILSTSDAGVVAMVEIGAQPDALVGGAAADRLIGMDADDDLIGLGGNDSIYGGRGEDVLSGRANDDRLFGGGENDVLVGGTGNDIIEGGAGADISVGGAGLDSLSFSLSGAAVTVNLLTGSAAGGDAAGDLYRGFENLIGSGFNDALTGTNQTNRIDGGNGNDQITGLAGADILYGGNGNDTISGGDQTDRIFGDAGNDSLLGGNGDDSMRGGTGNDLVLGDVGNDQLFGDDGADTLTGAAGNDTLDGGLGDDVFVFGLAFGDDEIRGFSIADDRLDLSVIPGINSLAEFQAAAITFAGNTLLSTADGSTVAIIGISESQFTSANFLF